MTDKEKIRKKIEIVINRRLNLLNGDHFDLNKEVDGFTNEIMDIINPLQEEYVSEDLEIEIKHCIYEPFFDLDGVAIKGATKYLTVEDIADIARYFANWQKKQDQETIELAEDHAMFAGMEKMKEQMMAKAIDATIGSFTNGTIYDADFDIDSNLKDNDKVKVIVIKEN